MKSFLLFIIFAFFLVACISGKTEYFPARGYSADVAEVTVIRENRMIGLGFSLKLLLDGNVIARLKSGQYVTFYVDPGVHTLGLPESTITVPCQRGRRHFILIKTTPGSYGWEVERISEKKAQFWMAQARPIE